MESLEWFNTAQRECRSFYGARQILRFVVPVTAAYALEGRALGDADASATGHGALICHFAAGVGLFWKGAATVVPIWAAAHGGSPDAKPQTAILVAHRLRRT